MKVLALETATSACSVACWHDHRMVSRFLTSRQGHAEVLVPMIAEVLAEAELTAADMDRLAVTVGPGAFTGLRVGLATARALALATKRPLFGLTTFTAIVHGLPDHECRGREILIAVDSRRRELFFQRFTSHLVPLGSPRMLSPEECARDLEPGPLLVAGDGAPALAECLAARPDTHFQSGSGLPDAAVIARVAAEMALGSGLPPRPLYLRAPDVTLPAATAP